jgi:hypothetical protein
MSTPPQNDSPAVRGSTTKRRGFSVAGVGAAMVRGPRRPMTLALAAAAVGLVAAMAGLIRPGGS